MTLWKIVGLAALAVIAFTFRARAGAASDIGGESLQKNIYYDQSSTSTPTPDPTNPFEFLVHVSPGSTGSLVANTSSVTPPGGSTGTITLALSGNGLDFNQYFSTKQAMDTAFGSGTYNLTINTSTPNTYHFQLAFGTDNYPSTIPQITNTTWSGGYLQIDPTQPYTITWPGFVGGDIYFFVGGNGISTLGGQMPADGNHNSYTIPANTLQAGQTYSGSLAFANNNGNPGADYFNVIVKFTIQAATPDVFSGSSLGGGWYYSAWFGTYNNNFYPWVNHNNLGFLYVSTSNNTDLYLYVLNGNSGSLGWLYTTQAHFPNVYSFTKGTWLYYSQGTTSFYNYTSQVWETY